MNMSGMVVLMGRMSVTVAMFVSVIMSARLMRLVRMVVCVVVCLSASTSCKERRCT